MRGKEGEAKLGTLGEASDRVHCDRGRDRGRRAFGFSSRVSTRRDRNFSGSKRVSENGLGFGVAKAGLSRPSREPTLPTVCVERGEGTDDTTKACVRVFSVALELGVVFSNCVGLYFSRIAWRGLVCLVVDLLEMLSLLACARVSGMAE